MKRRSPRSERSPDDPAPIEAAVTRRVRFGEADVLGIAWHGRYASFFEEASAALGRKCGLTYEAYREAGIGAPIAQLHIDYLRPLQLSEVFQVKASLFWTEAAKLNTAFEIVGEDGSLACTGHTIQIFIDMATREPLWFSPDLWDECRRRWRRGEFHP